MISGVDTSIQDGTFGRINPNPGIRFKNKKVPMKFDIETVDLLLAYAYNDDSQFITRAALLNLQGLIDMCNMNLYKSNQSLRARIDFLKLLLEARLDNGLDNRKLLLNYALERCEYREMIREEVIPELNKLKLSSRAIHHLNAFIADRLMYGYMYAYKDEIFRIYEDMESGNFKSLRELTEEFKGILTDLIFDIRNTQNYEEGNITLDLSEANFTNVVMQMVEKLKAPGNKLITGSQGINMLLNGGFEASRSYLFFGLPSGGKSVFLLNVGEWIRKFNKVKPKDPNKRPAVVYITQENSISETIERLFNMTVSGDDIRNYTPSEVVKLLRTKGQLTLNGKDDIDFIIKYYDDKEISTTDLYAIIEDIEDTGREVIALIHDYIERIRSSVNHPEIRLELAAVANDYSVLAKRLNIPVIGAGQINRRGSEIIDSASESNKSDLVRLLGRNAISESWGMLKNVDAAFFINKEYDSEGNEYMTFLKAKFRGKPGRKKKMFDSYLAHPFDPENGIKLMDDLHLDEPLSKTTLDDNVKELDVLKRGGKSLRERKKLNTDTKSEDIEQVDSDTIIDFKFLGEALKKRSAVDKKTEKITDKRADRQFDKIFTEYNTVKYKRNQKGYIKISQKRKSSSSIRIVAK